MDGTGAEPSTAGLFLERSPRQGAHDVRAPADSQHHRCSLREEGRTRGPSGPQFPHLSQTLPRGRQAGGAAGW